MWWKEAAGAIRDRPLGGWGAGSFGVVHLLYRRDALSVRQPHSVPLQWLAETGAVGALLAIGAFGLLLVSAVLATRRRASGSERLLTAALTAGAVAYAVHALVRLGLGHPRRHLARACVPRRDRRIGRRAQAQDGGSTAWYGTHLARRSGSPR